ncbi:MAG: Ig-like domain-containing protein, partial [Planctomycetota bacterium]
ANDASDRIANDVLEQILSDPNAADAFSSLSEAQQLELISELVGTVELDIELGFNDDEALANLLAQSTIDELNDDFDSLQAELQEAVELGLDSEFLDTALASADQGLQQRVEQLSLRGDSELQQQIREARQDGQSAEDFAQGLTSQSDGLGENLEAESFRRISSTTLNRLEIEAGNLLDGLSIEQRAELGNQVITSATNETDFGMTDDEVIERLTDSILDSLNNDFDTFQSGLQESVDRTLDAGFLSAVLSTAGTEVAQRLEQLGDRSESELSQQIREARENGESAEAFGQQLVDRGDLLNEGLESDSLLRIASRVLDQIASDSAASDALGNLTVEQQAELGSQILTLGGNLVALGSSDDDAINEIANSTTDTLLNQFASLQLDLDNAVEERKVQSVLAELDASGLLDREPLSANQIETLNIFAETFAGLEANDSAIEFFNRFFGSEPVVNVLNGFEDELQVNAFVELLQIDENFADATAFAELVADLSDVEREQLNQILAIELLGPNGSNEAAADLVSELLRQDDPRAELAARASEEASVETLVELIESNLGRDLSSDETQALKDGIRSRRDRGRSIAEITGEIGSIGESEFLSVTNEEQVDTTTDRAIEAFDQLIAEAGIELSEAQRRSAEAAIRDEAERGKSVSQISDQFENADGNSVASTVVREASERAEQAESITSAVENTRAGLSSNQNEEPLSDSEKDTLQRAIERRLLDGDSEESITSELAGLSVENFRRLIGRDQDNRDQSEQNAQSHRRNASESQTGESDSVGAKDPNDIVGPAGFGPEGFIQGEQRLDYLIRFENIDTATASAQEVFITHPIDDDFDLSTFELTSFGFGDLSVEIPQGRDQFETLIDLRDSLGLLVQFDAGIDLSTKVASWTFRAIDPETGDLVSDPFAGFLPPNVNPGEGEGFVGYSIRSKTALSTGARLDAEATIVFDLEDPINTPPIFNTIDADEPTSQLSPLPEITNTLEFPISWTGEDGFGSGVASFDVFVSEDNGPFELFADNITDTGINFIGQDNRRYEFVVLATDNVGRVEDKLIVAEVATTIDFNDAPSANNDNVSIAEDTIITIDVLSNDTDIDGDLLVVGEFTPPTDGVLLLSPSGDFTYEPNADFNGIDTFVYSIDDGRGGSSQGTVTINVLGVNDAPTTVDDVFDLLEDTPATINVALNDFDLESDPFVISVVDQPSQGTLTQLDANRFEFAPSKDFAGQDSFTYQASDGSSTSALTTVTLNVAPQNDQPVANLDDAFLFEDQTASFDVLTNDFDVDGDNLSVQVTQGPANGSVTVTSLGQLLYTPDPDFFGTELIVYRAVDPSGAFSESSLEIIIENDNDAPVVASPIEDVLVLEDAEGFSIDLSNVFTDIDAEELTLSVNAADPDLLSATITDDQLRLSFVGNANGTTLVTITANDGEFAVSSSFNVTVQAVNDEGVFAGDLDATIEQGDVATGTVTFTDVADGDTGVTFAIGTQPLGGSATITDEGAWSYTPNTSFVGQDSFIVEVVDDQGNLESQAIQVTVEPSGVRPPVRLEEGVLIIEGDQDENDSRDRIRVRRSGDDSITVRLRSGRLAEQQIIFDVLSSGSEAIDRIEITAGDGNDLVDVHQLISIPVHVDGGQGNDTIKTGAGDDSVTDLFGDNRIFTRGGNDKINTGDGRDRVLSGSGNDLIRTRAGNDVINAGTGDDIIVSGDGFDRLYGGSGRDLLIAGDRFDLVFGGSGQDILIGGWTVHDDDDVALLEILSEWTSNRTFHERVRNLWDGSGTSERSNGDTFLNRSTIIDDRDFDLLFGGFDIDWFPAY